MKKGSFKFICLIVWACIMISPRLFADEITQSFESRILESFNGDSDAKYVWKSDSSKFITKTDTTTYPILTYVDAWPVAVFGYNRTGDASLKSFGIHGRFDRKGYNWIDIYPALKDKPDEPFEIPIPGRVRNFDMWVWGANLKYYIEIYVRDYRGVVYGFKLGDISYIGWKNLQVDLPKNIVQSRRTLPAYAGLHFVKFRVWTQPVERVDDFYIYFKQFKILTDMFDPLFDGNDLADPDHVEKLWASNN